LHRVTSLTSLHLRSFHFSWLQLILRLNSGKRYQPNRQLSRLSINFYLQPDQFINRQEFIDGVPEEEFVRSILAKIPRLFPGLTSLNIDGIHGDVLSRLENIEAVANNQTVNANDKVFNHEDQLRSTSVFELVKSLKIRKCANLLDILEVTPNLERLELDYFPLEQRERPGPVLPNLHTLKLNRDHYRHGVSSQDLLTLLRVGVNLSHLHLYKVTLFNKKHNTVRDVSETEFLELLDSVPHLGKLSSLCLDFNQESCLTERAVYHILDRCPQLNKLENLLSWKVGKVEGGLNAERLARDYNMGVIHGTRYHWSLHWKGEDGRMYDSELPVDRF